MQIKDLGLVELRTFTLTAEQAVRGLKALAGYFGDPLNDPKVVETEHPSGFYSTLEVEARVVNITLWYDPKAYKFGKLRYSDLRRCYSELALASRVLPTSAEVESNGDVWRLENIRDYVDFIGCFWGDFDMKSQSDFPAFIVRFVSHEETEHTFITLPQN